MHIEFHGAAGGVTGSCHLLEVVGKRLLIDCGMWRMDRKFNATFRSNLQGPVIYSCLKRWSASKNAVNTSL